jgi:hypothetical protein
LAQPLWFSCKRDHLQRVVPAHRHLVEEAQRCHPAVGRDRLVTCLDQVKLVLACVLIVALSRRAAEMLGEPSHGTLIESVGERRLKNIPQPVRAFSITGTEDDGVLPSPKRSSSSHVGALAKIEEL